MHVLILADDLTGAADAAAPFACPGVRVRITPWKDLDRVRSALAASGRDEVLVIETDTRTASAAVASDRLRDVAASVHQVGAGWIVKKVDSLLRGPVGSEVTALLDGLGHPPVVVAPAFPELGRTTVQGRQYVHGRPAAEVQDVRPGPVSDDVAGICSLADAHRVSTGQPLPEHPAVIVDASTDRDLAHIIQEVEGRRPRPVLVGSAGLTHALARSRRPDATSHGSQTGLAPLASVPTLVVSLSPAGPARRQLGRLTELPDVEPVLMDLGALADSPERTVATTSAWLREAMATASITVLATVGEPPPGLPATTLRSTLLAATTALVEAVPAGVLFVANGGDATRCLVDALDADRLDVLEPLPAGAALTRTPGGARVVTKSGSFGDDDALSRIIGVAHRRVDPLSPHVEEDRA